MKKIWIIGLCALLCLACSKSEEPKPSSLIVEGWIDAGRTPVVFIHKSYVLDITKDSAQTFENIMERQLIPFGKVTISNGTDEVVLTGRLDTTYLPPYTYSSLDMTGEVGKTYTVTVDYQNYHATATTTIPPIASLDSLAIRPTSQNWVDVTAYMSHIDPDTESYYALFLRKFGDKQYKLCPFGVFDGADATPDGRLEMRLYNPISDSTDTKNYYFYDSPKDSIQNKTYQLKVARIDKVSYEFWKAYNEQIVTGGVVFVPVYRNIPSNVQGGYGNVSGMGSSFYLFNTVGTHTYHFTE